MAKIPILMYHDVTIGKGNDLTVSVAMLEKQFQYLKESGYQSVHLKELLDSEVLPSKKNIVITFDDGYISHLQLVFPLLQKYQLKAVYFIPLGFVGKTDLWNTASLDIMTLEQLKSLDPDVIELGFHSFYHKKYSEMSSEEIDLDLSTSLSFVTSENLNFSPVLAYPYGKFPKERTTHKMFNSLLENHGIKLGLRIGNRVNRFPFKKPFEVERIDIKGQWSLLKFKHRVRFGKLF